MSLLSKLYTYRPSASYLAGYQLYSLYPGFGFTVNVRDPLRSRVSNTNGDWVPQLGQKRVFSCTHRFFPTIFFLRFLTTSNLISSIILFQNIRHVDERGRISFYYIFLLRLSGFI